MANGAASAISASPGAAAAGLRAAQARDRQAGSPSLQGGAPPPLRELPATTRTAVSEGIGDQQADEPSRGAQLRAQQAQERQTQSLDRMEETRAQQTNRRSALALGRAIPGRLRQQFTNARAQVRREIGEKQGGGGITGAGYTQNAEMARRVNWMIFNSTVIETFGVVPLLQLNVEMIWGSYYTKGKSRYIPALTWKNWFRQAGFLPDFLLHLAVIALDMIVLATIIVVVGVTIYFLFLIGSLITEGVSAITNINTSGVPIPDGLLEALKPVVGL